MQAQLEELRQKLGSLCEDAEIAALIRNIEQEAAAAQKKTHLFAVMLQRNAKTIAKLSQLLEDAEADNGMLRSSMALEHAINERSIEL